MRNVLDLVSNIIINLPDGDFVSVCKNIGIDYTSMSKLFKGDISHVKSRYILENNIDKTFLITDIDSCKKYRCINNKTIFLHFGLPYNDNEAKYIYEIKSGRQKYASICGRVMCYDVDSARRIKGTKNKSEFISKNLDKQKSIAVIKRNLLRLLRSRFNKNKRTTDYIGCSINEFKKYIESRFVHGMSWDNYGLWHYDHIIPITQFDLTNQSDQHKAFHYTNIQPIWATTKIAEQNGHRNYIGNINKGDRMPYIDYNMVSLISDYFDGIGIKDNKSAHNIASKIWTSGFRKVI